VLSIAKRARQGTALRGHAPKKAATYQSRATRAIGQRSAMASLRPCGLNRVVVLLVLLREISFRHWMQARLRSLLIVLGIALGVGLYVATQAASDGLLLAYRELVQRIAGRADLCIQGQGLGVPASLLSEISELPGVAHAASNIELTVQAPDYDESLLLLGVDLLGDLHFLPFQMHSGERDVLIDPLSFVNDPSAILVSERFAARHTLRTGAELWLLTADGPKAFHVRGVLQDTGAASAFGGQLAVMFQDAAQAAFARGDYVDRIDVALAPGAQTSHVQQAVRAVVGPTLHVDEPDRLGARLRALSAPLEAGLAIMGFLSIVVGCFFVYNAVAVAVTQRKREVGTLRALGQTRGEAIALYMLEAAVLALPGSALGVLLGRALSDFSVTNTLETLNSVFVSTPQLSAALHPDLVARAFATGLTMALLSAYLPARRGAAIHPATALRLSPNVEPRQPATSAMLLFAVACAVVLCLPLFSRDAAGGFAQLMLVVLSATLATPAFLIGMRRALGALAERTLGVPGRLGLDSATRTLSRSTINVLALMVAVGMSFSVSSWLGSFERSLVKWAGQVGTADLTVTRGSPIVDRRHVPLRADAALRVQRVPGVASVQRFRMLDEQIGSTTLRLIATDSDVFLRESQLRNKGWEVTAGAPLKRGDLTSEPCLVLSENAAARLHVTAGDRVTLHTETRGELALRVRAVVVDFSSETGSVFLDLAFFHDFFRDDAIDSLFIYAVENADVDALADRVRRALASHAHDDTIFVTQTSQLERHLLDTLHRAFSYSLAVELMTLIIGLMGVVGTMVAAVLDRKREIRTLRAIGATRSQVAVALMVEAAFLGLCAASAGILVGVAETLVFFKTLVATETGWHLSFVFPWLSALRTSLLVVVTSALAGSIPAYHALKGDLTHEPVCE